MILPEGFLVVETKGFGRYVLLWLLFLVSIAQLDISVSYICQLGMYASIYAYAPADDTFCLLQGGTR